MPGNKISPSQIGVEVVEAVTTSSIASPQAIDAENDNRKLFTNEGAGVEQSLTLPSAAAGIVLGFYCKATAGIRAVASAGDTIRLATNVSISGGFVESTEEGAFIWLVPINATEWVALTIVGTWAVETS